MKKIYAILLLLIISPYSFAQTWNGTSTPTTTGDYNTSLQLTHLGWGSHHGILFNAYRSSSIVDGFLFTPGNTKHSFDVGPYSSGAGAIMYMGNSGRMDFMLSGNSTGAHQNVDWGAPKLTITRTGVGVGADDPASGFEVRKTGATIGQTIDVANFTFAGQNHFDQPNVFTEGKLVLGSKAYGNGVLRRAEIGFSTSANWRGGMLKFYTTPDDDTWTPLVRMTINQAGNVGIGTTDPGSFKLAVNGKIWTQEVNVAMTNPGPDYVFEKEYDLLSLSELETYINQNKHLPEVPSAKEMEAEGLNLKEMNLLLLKKVEELTLHLIEMKKQLDGHEEKIKRCNHE
jgi:hypothetical protein